MADGNVLRSSVIIKKSPQDEPANLLSEDEKRAKLAFWTLRLKDIINVVAPMVDQRYLI